MKQRKSDILWKVIIEEVFPDLLRFIYPDANDEYNMERGFEFLDKELAELNPQPDEEKDSRFADKLVKVFHRSGVEEYSGPGCFCRAHVLLFLSNHGSLSG